MFTDVGVTVSHLFKNEGVNPFWKVRKTLERVVTMTYQCAVLYSL
jgi:DNA phosphorothioation-dependent restriction protein DptG